MKRTFLILALVAIIVPLCAQKAIYVNGVASLECEEQTRFVLEPQFGYEISPMWAVGGGLGMLLEHEHGTPDTQVYGLLDAFARFTPWHLDFFYIDIKFVMGCSFAEEAHTAEVSFKPGIRFRIKDHWDISIDAGVLGWKGFDYYWYGAVSVNPATASLWLAYRF